MCGNVILPSPRNRKALTLLLLLSILVSPLLDLFSFVPGCNVLLSLFVAYAGCVSDAAEDKGKWIKPIGRFLVTIATLKYDVVGLGNKNCK